MTLRHRKRSTDSASDGAAPVGWKPDSEILLGFWYPAIQAPRIRRNRLRPVMLLGIPLVIGRDAEGRPFALRDSCPHRGMPLSFGRLDEDLLECCYHGWRFDPRTGQCREIPSLTSSSKLKVERIFVARFPCEEQDGHIWVYMPDPAIRDGAVPPVPRLPVFSPRYSALHLSAELPCSIDHGIIGLMDPAHGPFVHQSWWWPRRVYEKQKVFEPIANGFRMRPYSTSTHSGPYKLLGVYGRHPITTAIDFVLPNIRLEQIRCGPYWFSSRATVTPVTPEQCRIDFCAAWNILHWLPFAKLLVRPFARMFLREDQQAMKKQALGLKHNPPMMLIDDADRPARWYFQLKKAHCEAKRTGKPLEHPLRGPVTLRWHS